VTGRGGLAAAVAGTLVGLAGLLLATAGLGRLDADRPARPTAIRDAVLCGIAPLLRRAHTGVPYVDIPHHHQRDCPSALKQMIAQASIANA
jgi:hypothetical protein